MIVRFICKDVEIATRFYETYIPLVGDIVKVIGNGYKITSRTLDIDKNEVSVLLKEADEKEI